MQPTPLPVVPVGHGGLYYTRLLAAGKEDRGGAAQAPTCMTTHPSPSRLAGILLRPLGTTGWRGHLQYTIITVGPRPYGRTALEPVGNSVGSMLE
jgi:hypothetical protein